MLLCMLMVTRLMVDCGFVKWNATSFIHIEIIIQTFKCSVVCKLPVDSGATWQWWCCCMLLFISILVNVGRMTDEWLVTGICLADWCLWYANKYELDEEIVLFESILTEELFFNSFSHSTQFYTTAISNDYILGMYLRNFAF